MTYTPKMQASLAKYPLTRRGYELVAHCLNTSQPPPTGDSEARVQWYATVKTFTRELGKLPGFDAARFRKACGIEE